MQTAQNPPWASRVYKSNCVSIRAIASREGLPLPIESGECGIGQEYGQGHYGVVYPTEDPNVVFKITTDESEGHFIALSQKLAEQGVAPKGIVKYYGVFGIPGQHRGRPIFILWRESASAVGRVIPKMCGSNVVFSRPDPLQYPLCREAQEFELFIRAWLELGRKIREITVNRAKGGFFRPDAPSADTYWPWVKEQVDKMHDADGPDVYDLATQYLDRTRKFYRQHSQGGLYPGDFLKHYSRNPNRLAIFLSMADAVAQEMVNSNVSYIVGECLKEYLDAGVFMADVHMGNVGFVTRQDNDFPNGMPVITDPGHVILLKEELKAVTVEAI